MGYVYSQLKDFGLSPGLEFEVAMKDAERIGATLIYGDQTQEVRPPSSCSS